eukprot:752670-Hanusia_phi.AAC.5
MFVRGRTTESFVHLPSMSLGPSLSSRHSPCASTSLPSLLDSLILDTSKLASPHLPSTSRLTCRISASSKPASTLPDDEGIIAWPQPVLRRNVAEI